MIASDCKRPLLWLQRLWIGAPRMKNREPELMSDVLEIAAETRSALPFKIPLSRWSDADAASKTPAELLLYRSNLLGADLTVTNFGGGHTSAKLDGLDPLTGLPVRVLWVKGSGGDLGSMKLDGFATLYLDRLQTLQRRYRGPQQEDEMVRLYAYCAFGL